MPWEKKYDRTDVLERAMQAFWARGYEATSMSDLVTATGINRGSIYAAFTDKRGLFLKALKHYDKMHREDFLDRLAARYPPRQAILKAFDSAARPLEAMPPGCLLVNTALELSPHDPEVATFVRSSLDRVRDFFERMLEAARKDGSVPDHVSAAKTASALLGLFLGLRVMSRAAIGEAGTAAVVAQAEQMLH